MRIALNITPTYHTYPDDNMAVLAFQQRALSGELK